MATHHPPRHRGNIPGSRRSHGTKRRLSWVWRYSNREEGRFLGSERDDFSGIEIPSYVDAAGFRSSHNDGGIYRNIDSHVLYAIDKTDGLPVPGTNVCIEGDQLHTKERMMITEIKTDPSKCRS